MNEAAGGWLPSAPGNGTSTTGAVDVRAEPSRTAVLSAFVVPAALAVLDVIFSVRLTQLLVVGPCLAATSSRTRAVAMNVGWVVVLMAALSWPNHTVGSLQQAFTLAGGAAVGAVCVAITHRRLKLQRSLVHIERRRTTLAGIVQSAEEAVIGSSLDDTITVWNAAAERLFGYSAARAIGQSVQMLCPPASDLPLSEIRERVSASGVVGQYETTRLHADGRLLDVLVTVSAIRDLDGSVIGVATLASDLAPRRRAERERLAMVDQVHELPRVRSIGQLAGGIAHDFNNLLAVIINSVEFIESEIDDPVAVLSDAAQVRSAAERAANLTRQLLQFARGEHLPARTVDINAVVAGLAPLLGRTAGEAVDVVVRTSAEPLTVHADPGRLEQVLLNLITNARDAMPAGGTVVISTEVSGSLDASAADRGDSPGTSGPLARLTVADNGTGMSPEVAAQVFEPFFTTKGAEGSTGLGLASVQGIITEARGHINVQTAVGAGSTFLLELPMTDLAPTPATTPAHFDHPRRSGARVLLAEDEGPLRDVIARRLRRAGYEVLVAASGAEALQIAADQDIDLLLSDLLMPGMSGRELASALLARTPDLPVLFMSGYSDTALDVYGCDRAVDLLTKPFTKRQLLHRVDAALTRASAVDA